LLLLAGACVVAAAVLFGLIGYVLATGSGGGRGEASDAAAMAKSLRYALDPGGVHDRVKVRGRANEPYHWSVSVPTGYRDGPFGSGSFRLKIARIEVDAPVRTYGMNAALVPEVPLAGQEVAWYDFSALPGTGSNAVFAGHVSWAGGAVFQKLKKVQPGDKIELRDANGTMLVYTITESTVFDAKDKAILQAMGPASEDVITLITCDGDYRHTGDPSSAASTTSGEWSAGR
jgi:LPXTG-site transpeptidase (sortase) family protein